MCLSLYFGDVLAESECLDIKLHVLSLRTFKILLHYLLIVCVTMEKSLPDFCSRQ